jgi:hypothetical protein
MPAPPKGMQSASILQVERGDRPPALVRLRRSNTAQCSLRRSAGSFYWAIALHNLFRGKTNAVTPVNCDIWMEFLDPLSNRCLAYPRGSGENYEWTMHSESSISDENQGPDQ